MEIKKDCPYCKGSGFIETGFKEIIQKGHRTLYPYTEPCYCSINKSISKKFGMLSGIGDAHPLDAKYIHDRIDNNKYKNLLMFGKESLFLYLVKCYMLTGFMSKNYMILEGGTIVIKYNTPGPDKEWLSTSHLNQFDLLVILFTTAANYPTLKESVLEVIKNRSRLDVSTLVYHHSSKDYTSANDYSNSLNEYFKEYKKMSLGDGKIFKGYKEKDFEEDRKRKAIDLNDLAGKAS